MDNNFQNVKTLKLSADDVHDTNIGVQPIEVATSEDIETMSINITDVIRSCNESTYNKIKRELNYLTAAFNGNTASTCDRLDKMNEQLEVQNSEYSELATQLKSIKDDIRTAFKLQVKLTMYLSLGLLVANVILTLLILHILGG